MTVTRDDMLLLSAVTITGIVGFLISPSLGVIIGICGLLIGIFIILNNPRKYLDERKKEIFQASALHTLIITSLGALLLSLGVYAGHHFEALEEPTWFYQYSVQTSVILGVFVITSAVEYWIKGETLLLKTQ